MDNREIELMRQRAREKAAFLYTSALERGDFDTVAAVLAEAEDDPELERMLLEINETLESEYEASQAEREAQHVRALLRAHVPSGVPPDDETDAVVLPPLTVADVARRMGEDAAQHGSATAELVSFIQQLTHVQRTLPEELTLGTIRQLLAELGVAASAVMVKAFRETAIYLAQGREHGEAYRAAARRQRMSPARRDFQPRGGERDDQKEGRP